MIVEFATLGPLGKKMRAPGTWGSAMGLLWWALVVRQIATPKGWQHELAFDLLVALAAIFICGAAAAMLKKKDPSEVILDEMAAMPLVFFLNPNLHLGSKLGVFIVLLGFGLFRFFDIVKPLGIRWIERIPGGIGIVMDDVVAAIYANLCLQAICFYFSL
jgi:phosphatidylglycerophosphatase A